MDLKITDPTSVRYEIVDGALWIKGLPEITADNLPEPEPINTTVRYTNRNYGNEVVGIKVENTALARPNWRLIESDGDSAFKNWAEIRSDAQPGTLRTFSPRPVASQKVSDTKTYITSQDGYLVFADTRLPVLR